MTPKEHPAVRDAGPSLRGIAFDGSSRAGTRFLSKRQQQQLAGIATRMHLPARSILYREDTDANRLFIVADGVLKAYRDLPSGKRRVLTFLFADDVCGLAEAGRYVNTVQAITPVTVYRFDRETLIATLRRDAELQFQFLCKVTHELRQALRRTIVIGRRDAIGRIVMFLHMLEREHSREGQDIAIPMSRSDAANYLGLTLEAVSRGARALDRRGVVTFPDRHRAHVVNRRDFDQLAAAV